MTDYRRFFILGATWFFTVNLAQHIGCAVPKGHKWNEAHLSSPE